jgi:signal transduction histidine kinase
LTPEQRNEYLDIIIHESSRLAALATNVLNLSRVEKQAILTNRAASDLTEQVRRCALLFENKWEQRRLDLTVSWTRSASTATRNCSARSGSISSTTR